MTPSRVTQGPLQTIIIAATNWCLYKKVNVACPSIPSFCRGKSTLAFLGVATTQVLTMADTGFFLTSCMPVLRAYIVLKGYFERTSSALRAEFDFRARALAFYILARISTCPRNKKSTTDYGTPRASTASTATNGTGRLSPIAVPLFFFFFSPLFQAL